MNNEESIDLIVSRARELIHANGYRETTIRKICVASDISTSEFNELIGSKKELLSKVIAYEIEERKKAIRGVGESADTKETLHAYMDYLAKQYVKDYDKGSLLGNLIGQASPKDEDLLHALAVGFNEIAEVLRPCISQHFSVKKNIDSRKLALYIIATLEGIALINKAERDIWIITSSFEVMNETLL